MSFTLGNRGMCSRPASNLRNRLKRHYEVGMQRNSEADVWTAGDRQRNQRIFCTIVGGKSLDQERREGGAELQSEC